MNWKLFIILLSLFEVIRKQLIYARSQERFL